MKKILLSLCMLLLSSISYADPLKIRIWVGFAPGGATDIMARDLQKRLEEQDPTSQVIVEYAPGAAGSIALKKMANLPAGPYVELLMASPNLLLTSHINKMDVDLVNDVTMVAPIGQAQMVLLASPQSGIRDLKTLQQKAEKTKLFSGSTGTGSITYFATALVAEKLSVASKVVDVPYKGTSQTLVDLMAGRIDLGTDYLLSSGQHLRSGSLVGVAITGNKRSPLFPNIPTVEEQGIKDFSLNSWFGVMTNRTSNPEDVSRVKKSIVKILGRPDTVKRYTELGVSIVNPGDLSHTQEWYNNEYKVFKRLASQVRNTN